MTEGRGKQRLKDMKKMFVLFCMLIGMSTMVEAQVITRIKQVTGSETWVYLSDGRKVLYDTLPQGVFYSEGKTIEECIALAAYKKYADEASCYQLPVGAGMAGIYGMYPILGGNGTSFSIGNEHWGFSTSSSNYGGYKTSSTGIRIGGFHIGTSSAGYSKNDTTTAKSSKKNSKTVREVNLNDLMGGF